MKTVTHLMRAPLVGGSELETLAIVRAVANVRHRVLFPRRFAHLGPTIAARFPSDVPLLAVDDVERALADEPPELLHVQFPFVLVERVAGLPSVLELRTLPDVPLLFTVHAAVNVPVLPRVHYLFHTATQAADFAGRIAEQRITVCPSLVELPVDDGSSPPRAQHDDALRLLFVARHEDAKFHPDLFPWLLRLLDELPHLHARFVGRPETRPLPEHPRVSSIDCPAPDLGAEYRAAQLFAHLPDPRLHETWCRTVTEAMAHGLPCLVAAHGAMAQQVRDGIEGRVVSDLAEAARALHALAADRPGRARMGRAGRARARAFRDEALAVLPALYDRLLTHASPRAERA